MALPATCQQDPKIALAGRVVDMRSEPLPDAEVWVESAAPVQTWRTKTDGDGMYRIGVPRENIRHLYAKARGHCCVVHPLHEPFLPLQSVLHEAATVRGVLRNAAGAPVAGAMLFAKPRNRPGNAVATATSDEQGKFTIHGVALGSNQVAAWIDGEGLVMTTARVTGDSEVVLAPTGDPTTSMTVHLQGLPANESPRVELALTANFENDGLGGRPQDPLPFFVPEVPAGGWRIDHLPDREWIVAPYAKGMRFEPSVLTVAPGQGPQALEFLARIPTMQTTRVRATITDVAGAGVAGLRIAYYGAICNPRIDTATDSEGRLSFESPWAVDTATVIALDEGWLLRRRGDNDLARTSIRLAAGLTEAIEIEAIPAATLRGTLRRADGRPAALAEIQLACDDAGAVSPWRVFATTWTGVNGEFAFPQLAARDARLRMTVRSADGSLLLDGITLSTPGATVDLGTLELEPTAIVEGVVQNDDGAPLIGLRVVLHDRDPSSGRIGGRLTAEVVTDSRGRFRFLGVPAGQVQLTISPDGSTVLKSQPPFETEPGKTHQFVLRESGR